MSDKTRIHQKYLTLHLHGFQNEIDPVELRRSFAVYGAIKAIHTWTSQTQKQHAFVIFRDSESVKQATLGHHGPFQAENIIHNDVLQSILRSITSRSTRKASSEAMHASTTLSSSVSKWEPHSYCKREWAEDLRGPIARSSKLPKDTREDEVRDSKTKSSEKSRLKSSYVSNSERSSSRRPAAIETQPHTKHLSKQQMVVGAANGDILHVGSGSDVTVVNISRTVHKEPQSELSPKDPPRVESKDVVERVLDTFKSEFSSNTFETNRQVSIKVKDYAAQCDYNAAEHLGSGWLQFIGDGQLNRPPESPLFMKPLLLTLASVKYAQANGTQDHDCKRELLAAARELVKKAEDRPGCLDFFKLRYLVDFAETSRQCSQSPSQPPTQKESTANNLTSRKDVAHIALVESICKEMTKDVRRLKDSKRRMEETIESERQKRRKVENDLNHLLNEQRDFGKATEDDMRTLLKMLQEEKAKRIQVEDELWLLRRRHVP
ncbi:hypothetical protein FRC02_010507 [Tulasnella sp. 418]|nr:hypothetical protein FRC02_010507 [Tulasnella sp. 418]